MVKKILDVRELAPKERHPMIFNTFKGLEAGESFILVNDHEPKPLLYQFQAEHEGEFEWWTLEQGPAAWRVEIAKREFKEPDRSITDFFQTDHRRLDAIVERFRDAVDGTRWEDASRDFREFSLGLRRHIQAEEEILFPLFEQKTGMTEAGPTFVMKMEHKEIKEFLDKILAAADARDASTALQALNALINILTDHNMKEEHILYPESDGFITEAERAQVLKKTQAL
jgi:uncharacterized protein (DUF2249 family)/hemerythrin-like domain-containing protein